jgi:hypothetical protein
MTASESFSLDVLLLAIFLAVGIEEEMNKAKGRSTTENQRKLPRWLSSFSEWNDVGGARMGERFVSTCSNDDESFGQRKRKLTGESAFPIESHDVLQVVFRLAGASHQAWIN